MKYTSKFFLTLSFSLLISLFSIDSNAQSANVVEMHGQLKIYGTRIYGNSPLPVQLRGMSLFWSQWQGKYWNKEAIKWLRDDWQCTIVRAAMGVEKGGYLENPESELKKVEDVIDACIELGVYVLVDYHAHEAHKDPESAKKFFGYISKKYGAYPNVIYETFNEPLQNEQWTETLKPYHESIIKVIRANDPDNIIICGTRQWSQMVNEAADDPIEGKNIAYTLHFYAASHKQDLRNIAQQALDKGICLFITEYGLCPASGDGDLDVKETQTWWEFCDKNDISWCNWSIADKDETASAVPPKADVNGGWPEESLTQSGALVRQECKRKNPRFEFSTY